MEKNGYSTGGYFRENTVWECIVIAVFIRIFKKGWSGFYVANSLFIFVFSPHAVFWMRTSTNIHDRLTP